MNYSNPHGWKKRLATRRKRLAMRPSAEVRAIRRDHTTDAYSLQPKGVGWYDVIGPEGRVNEKGLRKAEAEALLEERRNAGSPATA